MVVQPEIQWPTRRVLRHLAFNRNAKYFECLSHELEIFYVHIQPTPNILHSRRSNLRSFRFLPHWPRFCYVPASPFVLKECHYRGAIWYEVFTESTLSRTKKREAFSSNTRTRLLVQRDSVSICLQQSRLPPLPETKRFEQYAYNF